MVFWESTFIWNAIRRKQRNTNCTCLYVLDIAFASIELVILKWCYDCLKSEVVQGGWILHNWNGTIALDLLLLYFLLQLRWRISKYYPLKIINCFLHHVCNLVEIVLCYLPSLVLHVVYVVVGQRGHDANSRSVLVFLKLLYLYIWLILISI